MKITYFLPTKGEEKFKFIAQQVFHCEKFAFNERFYFQFHFPDFNRSPTQYKIC